MKDLRSSVVKRHLEGEGKTAEQMINMIRMVKAKQTKEASTKKNTPVEWLKRKRTELGTTSAREHTEKKTMKTEDKKEPDGGTRSSREETRKNDMRNEISETQKDQQEMGQNSWSIMLNGPGPLSRM